MSRQREDTARRLWSVAEEDLYSAEALSTLERVPAKVVAFHCQQAVEKALKACLTLAAAEEPPWTHSLRLLSERMAELGLPALDDDDAALLGAYAVAPRYGLTGVTSEAAMDAVAAARRIMDAYEGVLRRLLGEDA